MRMDRQTLMTKQIVAFRNFTEAPENVFNFEISESRIPS